MGHHHHHLPHSESKLVTKNLKVVFLLNLTFTVIEFLGGFLTNSVAILSDAVHDLGDTLTIGAAFLLERYSQKPPDKFFSFGYNRFSPLAALISSAVLVFGAVFIVIESVPRLLHPEPVHTNGMMVLAILGILFNGLAVLRLRTGNNSSNQQVISLHLMEDVLGWVAILLGSIAMSYGGWSVIDPILSIGISLYIMYNALKPVPSLLKLFLQAVPEHVEIDRLKVEIENIKGVLGITDIHAWAMDDYTVILTLHIVVDAQVSIKSTQSITSCIREKLASENINHVTIELEPEDGSMHSDSG